MTPSTTSTVPISFWNKVNLITYLVNAAIVYSVGLYGVLGQGNNAVISAKYQTLFTPARWTFVIWAFIYISELVWAVLQLAVPRYRVKALQYVHNYNFVLVCLAQIAWTIAFGLQMMRLSIILMTLILALLLRLIYQARHVQAQHHDEATWWTDYVLLRFPFTVHAGWIMAATLLNANVVLVAYQVNVNVELFTALTSLVLVLVASSIFLALPDFTVPLVLIWASTGIYMELGHPQESIRTRYSDRTVQMVQKAVATAILAVLVSFLTRLSTSWSESRRSSPSINESLREPLVPAARPKPTNAKQSTTT